VRRITLALVSTIAALVLLFSYRTSLSGPGGGAAGTAPAGIVDSAGSDSAAGGDSAGPADPTASPSTGRSPAAKSSTATRAPASRTVTVNGTVVDNGFGPVQVQVKITSGKIVDVTTLALPPDGHSQRINSYAVPQLRQEVLQAQSAKVDTVSGATDTSYAYVQSLQAALDAAHFKG
jgi:uncharacterized protein with FMN-binding domain